MRREKVLTPGLELQDLRSLLSWAFDMCVGAGATYVAHMHCLCPPPLTIYHMLLLMHLVKHVPCPQPGCPRCPEP